MISHRLRSLVLLFFSLLQFRISKEQTNLPEYSVVNYNSDNALPQNSIKGMVFDKNGFLWLATEMGLVRFDGRNFREYNMANSPALVSNRCSLLNAAEGSVKIFVDPRFGNHRILTVTEDYQMRVDSILSANPYQSNQGNNRLFSFANLYKKWAAGGDTTVFNGLGLKQE